MNYDTFSAKPLTETWNTSRNGEYMLRKAEEIGVNRKLLVAAACECVRLALKFVPEGEERPRHAIEVTEAWCRGEVGIEKVKEAAKEAYAAASASAYAHAYAAHAYAAHAASAAASASAYAASAAASASAAYDNKERLRALALCAKIVRKHIPLDVMLVADSEWRLGRVA